MIWPLIEKYLDKKGWSIPELAYKIGVAHLGVAHCRSFFFYP